MLHRRDGDPCNRRKPIMTIPTVQDRCLSFWRPGGNRLIVSLPCPSLRLLGTPSHPLEDVPHIPRMVCHPKFLSYHLSYALQVHKSVGKTAALASFNKMPSNSFFCSADSLSERPRWGLVRKASSPPCFSCCFQRETEEGETPINQLTSRTPLPSSNSRPPIMWCISNAQKEKNFIY